MKCRCRALCLHQTPNFNQVKLQVAGIPLLTLLRHAQHWAQRSLQRPLQGVQKVPLQAAQGSHWAVKTVSPKALETGGNSHRTSYCRQQQRNLPHGPRLMYHVS